MLFLEGIIQQPWLCCPGKGWQGWPKAEPEHEPAGQGTFLIVFKFVIPFRVVK